MAQVVDVVFDGDGVIVAMGFPPSAPTGNAPQGSGPDQHPGVTAAKLELPAGMGPHHAVAALLRVDNADGSLKLVAR